MLLPELGISLIAVLTEIGARNLPLLEVSALLARLYKQVIGDMITFVSQKFSGVWEEIRAFVKGVLGL